MEMESNQETIFFANGNCDLDALDHQDHEENSIAENLPRELKCKNVYQLLDEYFQDKLDTNEPWDELSSKIQDIYKDIDEELDIEFSYYVCCFIGKCKILDIIPIKESFKDLVIKLIKYYKKNKMPTNEQLNILENALIHVNQYVHGEDWFTVKDCVSCFENCITVENKLKELLWILI